MLSRAYFVNNEIGIFMCSTKGKMRLDSSKPLVGDIVEFDIDEHEANRGIIKNVIRRKNNLIRPEVANVDRLIIMFAMNKPAPNLELLDRLLLQAEKVGISPFICFNKTDLVSDIEVKTIGNAYKNSGYEFIFTSDKNTKFGEVILKHLVPGVNVFAGPSGVGKSTIINAIKPDANMETGEISEKLKRGKHTTRHSELIDLGEGVFLCDTPGFTSYDNENVEPLEVQRFMPDFNCYNGVCKYSDCLHLKEPGCELKDALIEGKISESRYNSYKVFVDEATNSKKNKY